MNKYGPMLTLLMLVIFMVGCAKTIPIPENKSCSADTDCVPASCCHPNDAVNKDFMPDCSSTMCTMECVPNTLDCGQGEVKCVEKECKAVMQDSELIKPN